MLLKTLPQLRTAEQQFDLQWVLVESGSPFIDKSIGEAEIRKATGASVVGVIRGDKLEPNPDIGFRFRLNDMVAIIGTDKARATFRRLSRSDEEAEERKE
ncbi:MAG: TrkA C-terminal domain-containing protein [Thermodesulfobacteriota bacterium]|nr:TrkA C-terminal domain-containing protein [Thermodesulfobacteriota bacterium]